MLTGDKLNKLLDIRAEHALYREDGKWYHPLKHFPGVLFDLHGMLLFDNYQEYLSHPKLQHGKDLHIVDGISKVKEYRYFNQDEQNKIQALLVRPLINLENAWEIFITKAKEYESQQEIFVSPSQHKRYKVISTKDSIITISRLDKLGSKETIGKEKFTTCISRINGQSSHIKKGSIYEHVIEETTIVELLPELDWDETGRNILVLRHGLTENDDTPEANNDNINERIARDLKVRRGQKKMRTKLFYQYSNKCAITDCAISEVLHACHIDGFASTGNNLSTNAILLKSDIHDLFDANLLVVNPDTLRVQIHKSLERSEYMILNGKSINKRKDGKVPNRNGLILRWKKFKK